MRRTQLRRALTAAVIMPVVLVLSACGMKTNLDVLPDGTGNVSMEIEIDSNFAAIAQAGADFGCDQILREMPDGSSYEAKDMSDSASLRCLFQSKEPVSLESFGEFEDKGDTVVFTMNALSKEIPSDLRRAAKAGASLFDVEFKVNMPGKILNATGPGKVSGRTYELHTKDISDLGESIEIESNKQPGLFDNVMSWLPWLLAAIVVIAIGAAVVLWLRRRPTTAAAPATAGGSGTAAPFAAPPAPPAPPAVPQGQPPAVPQSSMPPVNRAQPSGSQSPEPYQSPMPPAQLRQTSLEQPEYTNAPAPYQSAPTQAAPTQPAPPQPGAASSPQPVARPTAFNPDDEQSFLQ